MKWWGRSFYRRCWNSASTNGSPSPFAHMHIITEGGRNGRRETVSGSQLPGEERNWNRKTAPVKTRKALIQGGKVLLNRQRRWCVARRACNRSHDRTRPSLWMSRVWTAASWRGGKISAIPACLLWMWQRDAATAWRRRCLYPYTCLLLYSAALQMHRSGTLFRRSWRTGHR